MQRPTLQLQLSLEDANKQVDRVLLELPEDRLDRLIASLEKAYSVC